MATVLTVQSIQILPHRIYLLLDLNGVLFSHSTWFPGINLNSMAASLGSGNARNLMFHAILFDLQSFMSAGTEIVDVSVFNLTISPALENIWHECGKHQWAEWRYLNGRPGQPTPRLVGLRGSQIPDPISLGGNESAQLLLFSGGKDSLASSMILEERGTTYDTLFVLQSKDGRIDLQRNLINRVLASTKSRRHHEAIIFEDYIPAPIASCTKYNFKGIIDGFAETVSCMFKALLFSAAFNYRYIQLGNEAAADEANFVWSETGEPVNHQWGKSLSAENLINQYVDSYLIPGVRFSSLLRGMQDQAIFEIVSYRPDELRNCHSCNNFKPWCRRCSKCCYVWLSYCAYLGKEFAMSVFLEDLFEVITLREVFQGLYVGHKPFECVGNRGDVVRAFRQCVERGQQGFAIAEFRKWESDFDPMQN